MIDDVCTACHRDILEHGFCARTHRHTCVSCGHAECAHYDVGAVIA